MTNKAIDHKARPLPGPLRHELNRLAHRAALETETRLRDAWTARLERAAKDGATPAELAAMLASAATSNDD